jgi:hypothetical protein
MGQPMKPILLLSTAFVFALASAPSAEAQASSTPRTACDSVPAECVRLSAAADSAVRELERAATELAKAVEQTVRQTANNPELRLQTMKLAAGALAVAQQTLVQNADMLERMLAEASRQIALAQAALEARTEAKKP